MHTLLHRAQTFLAVVDFGSYTRGGGLPGGGGFVRLGYAPLLSYIGSCMLTAHSIRLPGVI